MERDHVMSMRQLIEKIESGFGRVWDREMSRKDKWRVENKNTELGHYQLDTEIQR